MFEQDFESIADSPNSLRRRFTASRPGTLRNNTQTTVLLHLAREKYAEGTDFTRFVPFWIDRDWANETYSNIGLMQISAEGQVIRNASGFAAGTPEYWKAYRTRNKDRMKEYTRRAQDKRKIALELAQAELEKEEERLALEQAELAMGLRMRDGVAQILNRQTNEWSPI